ncbi:MFS transporter [Comamonas testosteroni]|uniref:MFS transporter n=1 Tax=Comamonas testosteroni TaxID=285 RepID=UPI0023AA6571|nr:MFS transporter [Comamonas testosteroni]WEE76670.1 MFS transporter [Comamonas testosteroni]
MSAATLVAKRSWWPQQLLIGWFNLVLTAPIIYLFVGLPLMMRQHGWSGTEIGLLQLAGLPAVLKFVLATPLDRWHLGKANYRNWAIVLSAGYALALLLLAANDLTSTPYPVLFALAMIASLLGTWADVPVNALAIRILPESERIRAGAIRSLAASLAAIAGGGLMLVLHTRLGWAWPFIVMSASILPCVVLLRWLGTSESHFVAPSSGHAARAGFSEWIGYFRVAEHRVWTLLLLFYFPAIGAAWVYLKPLMLDHGFAQEQIAWGVGVVGGLVAAIASLLAGRIIQAIGARIALPLFAVLNTLAMLGLAVVVITGLGKAALMAAAMVLASAMGASAGLLFGLMMNHARQPLAALDYGVQSSLFVASRTTAPLLVGILLDSLGYGGMLMGLVITLCIVCLLAWFSRDRVSVHGNADERGRT